MFDIGWTELLVIGVVALIVVGPKDLPKMFRALGQFTAKARNMAREFQRAMEDAADASGVKDVARDLRNVTNPKAMALDELNKLKSWDPLKSDTESGSGLADLDTDLDQAIADMEQVKRPTVPQPAPQPVAGAAQAAPPPAAPPASAPSDLPKA
jgi:sec-independent protein translocase protein TatB